MEEDEGEPLEPGTILVFCPPCISYKMYSRFVSGTKQQPDELEWMFVTDHSSSTALGRSVTSRFALILAYAKTQLHQYDSLRYLRFDYTVLVDSRLMRLPGLLVRGNFSCFKVLSDDT